uniref:FAD-dependent thymidylate synthase n=1 Tax=Magnetococcus massalia (strain MO-1) TaxID=451514 RepID=A0A1S7LKX9_MAGMO|nr:putative Thymidylate synthase ThyX [Candidatus Magnetococcus massalia]
MDSVQTGTAFQTEPTREILKEMETRLQLNPDYTARVGNFGFIELEESWGDEATIINTARISTTNKRVEKLEDFTDKERTLLHHLLANNHGTPFESVHFRWRVIAPIFVLRQWMRHRICSFNEFSQRYRRPITAFYVPDEEACTVDGFEVMTQEQVESYCNLVEQMHKFYLDEYEKVCARVEEAEKANEIKAVAGGRNPYRARARELLRNAMPVSTYSDLYWTINFRSLMNFFELRRKANAQYEIREFADAAYTMFKRKLPLLGETMDRVLDEREKQGSGNE